MIYLMRTRKKLFVGDVKLFLRPLSKETTQMLYISEIQTFLCNKFIKSGTL